MNAAESKVLERVKRLMSEKITLRVQRDSQNQLCVPTGAGMMFKIDFTIPELREAGCQIEILTEDGRVMTDDEYAAALQAEIKQRG